MSMLKAPLRLQAHQAAIAEASKTASIFHGGPKTRFILPTPPARRQHEPELKQVSSLVSPGPQPPKYDRPKPPALRFGGRVRGSSGLVAAAKVSSKSSHVPEASRNHSD